MANIDELREKLKFLLQNLPEMAKPVATEMSLTGKALAERIIKDKGFGKEYSDTQLPNWFLKGKGLNKKGEKAVTKGAQTWKEVRKEAGLQIDYVDLSYSNEMWRGMLPQEPIVNGATVVAPLAHNNTAGQNKMDWNRARYGDFIGAVLKEEQRDLIAEVGTDGLARIVFDFLKPKQ